jgi:hypothetical protein
MQEGCSGRRNLIFNANGTLISQLEQLILTFKGFLAIFKNPCIAQAIFKNLVQKFIFGISM